MLAILTVLFCSVLIYNIKQDKKIYFHDIPEIVAQKIYM